MTEMETVEMLNHVLDEFSPRYKDINSIFLKHFYMIKHLLDEQELNMLTPERKLLLGSYFTMEYSIEAAALFNPSIVEDPDQSGIADGEKKVILSFRATGENHLSSLTFKRGRLDKNAMIHLETDELFMGEGIVQQKEKGNKAIFAELLEEMLLPIGVRSMILNQLNDSFTYKEIEAILKNALSIVTSEREKSNIRYDILSMVNTSYELHFPKDSHLSERVIFPVTYTEKNGIEDARFVKFTDEYGESTYIATYTAYDGTSILPHLIETKDFCRFKMSPLHGKAAINKNFALFPRKVNGKYAMLSRIDGVNNYIMFSDDLYTWETATLLQEPKFAWDLVQIGNGGSPIETNRGWLVITHGVGPMRRYCLGASLFDLNDPGKELGRLKEPLLMPNEHERHGYVPNVVYTCGPMIHNNNLILPYAVSDYASSFATIPLNELLDEIMKSG